MHVPLNYHACWTCPIVIPCFWRVTMVKPCFFAHFPCKELIMRCNFSRSFYLTWHQLDGVFQSGHANIISNTSEAFIIHSGNDWLPENDPTQIKTQPSVHTLWQRANVISFTQLLCRQKCLQALNRYKLVNLLMHVALWITDGGKRRTRPILLRTNVRTSG